jgi:hypothetical protein
VASSSVQNLEAGGVREGLTGTLPHRRRVLPQDRRRSRTSGWCGRGDGATLGEVRVTHPLAVVEAVEASQASVS